MEKELTDELSKLLTEGEFKQARALVMEQAADAASAGEQARLGSKLMMLGQIAIEEQDLDAAEVYLLEALEIAQDRDDDNAVAHVSLQLGRKHLRSRQLARIAGEAYDILLVARNQLARNQFVESRENLMKVIDDNLHIRRYGAAASAYESLISLHTRLYEPYLAETAAIEAASLYAKSGQDRRAYGIINQIRQSGMDSNRLYFIEQEISTLSARFKNDMAQVERARDYQRLYHHYAATGNHERAWKLRLMASQSLAKTAKRTLYHRQADVLAVLYESNSAMEKARGYLSQASTLFETQGQEDLSSRSRKLSTQIY